MVDTSGSILTALDGCLGFLEKKQYGEAELVLRYVRQAFFSNYCEPEDQKLNETIEKGMELLSKQDVEEALPIFQEAYEYSNRRSRVAFVNICYCLFHLGKYKEFWTHYEDRLHHFDQLVTYRNIFDPEKRWNGEDNLNNKKVVVFAEQGLGDCIMFARYLPKLKVRYPEAHIVINASKVLKTLFEEKFQGFDEFLPKENVQIGATPFAIAGDIPKYDLHFPIMSFPYLLKEYEPKQEVYCSMAEVTDELPRKLRSPYTLDGFSNIVSITRPLRIGIICKGNSSSGNDSTRSIDPNWFRKLSMEGVELHNLHHQDDMEIKGVINHTPMKDFLELYNLISKMDLIICVDTAIFHLSGAMGLPVVALIPYVPDWRWKLTGETTDWYKNVTLIRQEYPGDWESVFKKARKMIEGMI